MAENSRLPAPKDAFLSVVTHLALGVLVGSLDVATFDQAVHSLIAATDGELQAELVQIELLARRVLADVV